MEKYGARDIIQFCFIKMLSWRWNTRGDENKNLVDFTSDVMMV